jgi:hypothetical protein
MQTFDLGAEPMGLAVVMIRRELDHVCSQLVQVEAATGRW